MLQLKEIVKSYTTGDFTQTALDGVTIAFRDNEFAAVLGPSGSGKTTMLNIIGGLDHYDAGDLEIDSISTKDFSARDWDTYRNNRIGFVFQSYNLIPHQSVVANVELALTLSGVSKAERRERAKRALERVGLEDHIYKKPSQLSGGQMQRVAIARAIINEPEILLADEPTGALDTQTSKQVMELLSEIANERLVIMVTHNHELANEYANRIVTLRDGKVVGDTNHFDPSQDVPKMAREPKRASMSFFTAINLSFSNLMTKKGRTLITAFAGSIGIIGIAAILALANGINAYIRSVEEDTMSLYPLTIMSSGYDLSSIMDDTSANSAIPTPPPQPDSVREVRIVESVFNLQNLNDLKSLKSYFDKNQESLDQLVKSIQYKYSLTPQIFLSDTTDGVKQVSPDSVLSSYGMGGGNFPMLSLMGGGGAMNVFSEMPGDLSLFEEQYEIITGKWPQRYDETVLVLNQFGRMTDMVSYGMGLRDRKELQEMADSFINQNEATIVIDSTRRWYTYNELMSVEFKVVNQANLYQYDNVYEIWVDKSGDSVFMAEAVNNASTLKIVGIVKPLDTDVTNQSLSTGINYMPELTVYLMQESAKTNITKQQLANPDVNVISGRTFEDEEENPENGFDFSKIISIDENAFRKAFDFDLSALMNLGNLDFSTMNLTMDSFDLSSFDLSNIDLSSFDLSGIDVGQMINDLAAVVQVSADDIRGIIYSVLNEFLTNQVQGQGIVDPQQLMDNLPEFLQSRQVQRMIRRQLQQIARAKPLDEQVSDTLGAILPKVMEVLMEQFSGAIENLMQAIMEPLTSGIMSGLQDALSGAFGSFGDMKGIGIDVAALTDAFKMDMGEEEILELMTSMMYPRRTSYERNLSAFGYGNLDEPSSIYIYPNNFNAKQEILTVLDQYNERMKAANEEDKVVYFTDFVGLLMNSVTDIVDMVSYALIAFVAISLIVSSIMIGVITFISVMERRKEIGILRAMGASKGNIRLVFNAETMIIGFVAGLIGVLITTLIVFIANKIIFAKLDIVHLVVMPARVPFMLVGISMFLTLLSGLFPANAAASAAPVEALRSE
ncbi:MAG: ABC transporter ATP-binding protein/permease [Eubacteriaceae bacterium]|nr:ABC transporter ATP-binding protein/permease [Eubacteriaceae bacterium]